MMGLGDVTVASSVALQSRRSGDSIVIGRVHDDPSRSRARTEITAFSGTETLISLSSTPRLLPACRRAKLGAGHCSRS